MNRRSTLKMLAENSVSGFTLIEVLIAIAILTIGLLAISALTVGIMRGNTHSDRLTTATMLAQEKMEDISRLGYSGAIDSTEDYNSIASYPLFKRVTSIAASTPGSNMKTSTVTVYWDSDDKSVVLQTILANEG